AQKTPGKDRITKIQKRFVAPSEETDHGGSSSIVILPPLVISPQSLVVAVTPGYRNDTPDRFVYMRAAMFIEASSWNSSLAAYGMCTCEILFLFLHARHSKSPFFSLLIIPINVSLSALTDDLNDAKGQKKGGML